ncbi:MAG: hypothetical protein Q4G71_15475 [Pseudomonadota bacterium]|nr:hypothetical protein [Pseudomonadota bacterium]
MRRDTFLKALATLAITAKTPLTARAADPAPFNYLLQSDFAKSISNLLYAPDGSPSIGGWDPYWVDTILNKSATGVSYAVGNNGYNAQNKLVAYRLLKVGIPSVDLTSYTGLHSPNTIHYRGSTAGVMRATGVQVDDAGRVGIFLNGFDTPSVREPSGRFLSYGPDIHLLRSYVSPQIYIGTQSPRCMHMSCKLTLGATWFNPAAGVAPGVGGQIGWRASFKRSDGLPFFSSVREIVLVLGFWDSRTVGNPGFDGNDSIGNVTAGEHWIAGTLVAGKFSKFVTNHGANMLTGSFGNRSAMFYWSITRANMINILEAFGATTTTPEMIRLSGSTFSGELYDNRASPSEFKPGQFGFSVSDQVVSVW